ncbi:MAG TPA: NAD-dependent epimerase/dehydratase family protein [Candidatus Solibacter sp.]|nr:NAD-dependent epimerase/dehydratase family protein [Candidatus Solibacter sp.]
MSYDPYSRFNQQSVDAAIVGVSFYLGCLIAYTGTAHLYLQYQFWVLLAVVVAGRLLWNSLCGLHRMQWRYIGVRDALRTAGVYLAFSGLLLLAQTVLSEPPSTRQLVSSVIIFECLVSLVGALGVRILRRYIYEIHAKREDSTEDRVARRVLLIGAGMIGASIAREMATDPSVQIVGFLDDDLDKADCVIGGVRVLGPTSLLAEIAHSKKVDSVLLCISPGARGAFTRLFAVLNSLPVTTKFVPTLTEILDSDDPLHFDAATNGNGHARTAIVPPATPRVPLQNRTILITGGAGFIGSSLAERLAEDNEIILFDRAFHNQPIAFSPLYRNPKVRKIEGDILDENALRDIAREANIVVHAAAIVGVEKVCTYPKETLETNFVGVLRILKALEKSVRLERFLYFSTSEVFGVNSFRVNEGTPAAIGSATEARWSYAIAKLAGEHLVKAYHRQTGMPVATVRPFNVFGPRRLGAHAILSFVQKSFQGVPIQVHGDGLQLRSWCYIEDFCDALIEILSRTKAIGEDFNIGNPQNTITVLELARLVAELTGSAAPIELVESHCPDIEVRVPSLEKARQILDYQPSYDLRRGLKLTVNWYREHLESCREEPSYAQAVGASR